MQLRAHGETLPPLQAHKWAYHELEAALVSIRHCDEVPMKVAVGQQWGIFSSKAQRWAVATVISVENGTVNLKYRDHPGFCRLAAVEMLTFNDDLQFLEPLEEIPPRKWHG
jgi:hypothetical protein